MDRLNVVVLLTDQQTADAMSAAGNPHLRTPAMDALAAEGVRFRRAYCTQPLCTPSRASMWTGRMPSAVGVTVNDGRLTGRHATEQLGQLFRDAGYDCGYGGKWHLPELAVPADAGYRRIHGEPEDGLTDACIDFVREPRDKPFLLVASYTEPHGICQWARRQTPPSGEVAEVDWTQWPPLPGNYATGSYEAELPRLAQSRLSHTFPTMGWREDDWRRYRHAYYRLVERVDAQLGRLLDALRESGQRDRTLVVFSSDHGDQLGAHQWSQKWVLYEESLRVPLIVAPPGRDGTARRRETDDRLVSVGLDLLPTLCDYAGIEPPADLPGRTLRPALDSTVDTDPGWRDAVYAETTWEVPGVQHVSGRMVRTERFKYACYAWGRDREQLFDLDTDPGELSNLATVGTHRETLEAHRALLRIHCEGQKFARFLPAPGSPPR